MNVPSVMRQRTVVLVTPDTELRERIGARLLSMRWTVLPAAGGAEAMAYLGAAAPEAIIVDHWLPDLDATEFTEHAAALCPGTDLLQMNGGISRLGSRSLRRNELLHALREAQDSDTSTYKDLTPQTAKTEPSDSPAGAPQHLRSSMPVEHRPGVENHAMLSPFSITESGEDQRSADLQIPAGEEPVSLGAPGLPAEPLEIKMQLPDMVGSSKSMCEMARLVRMVAPHAATVLIQGETGTGKELVAKAVHRLSARASKAFVVLNCAAIPEQLLEAELFGHTRGAFTGAVTSRVGRIEAAHGGTLFLDEIGEMPLPLQAKMLRFLESGEIQRVGDNDTSRVDVRIVAATHQPLEANAGEKLFRLDLYHRLAVFPVEVPSLRSRREDIPMLVEFFLRKFAESAPRKSISQEALSRLSEAEWNGNVRELCHVMQRAIIMAGDAPLLGIEHLRMRSHVR